MAEEKQTDQVKETPSEEMKSLTFSRGDRTFRLLFLPELPPTPPGAPPAVISVVEPFTWAWLGVTLCEGVIAAIGAKLIGDLLGWNTVTKQDLQDVLRDFLKAIATVVRQELERNDIEQIQASAASLQSLIMMYYNGNHALLNPPLIMKADELAHQAARFSYRSVSVFAVLGSLELTILQEIYNHAKTAGNKRSIGIRAADLLTTGEKIPSELNSFNKSRFSEVYFTRIEGGFDVWMIITRYGLDGHPIDVIERTTTRRDYPGWPQGVPIPPPGWAKADQESGERARQQHIDSEYKRLEKEILVPFYAVESKWKEIAEKNK